MLKTRLSYYLHFTLCFGLREQLQLRSNWLNQDHNCSPRLRNFVVFISFRGIFVQSIIYTSIYNNKYHRKKFPCNQPSPNLYVSFATTRVSTVGQALVSSLINSSTTFASNTETWSGCATIRHVKTRVFKRGKRSLSHRHKGVGSQW
jgi:hypothetical protein